MKHLIACYLIFLSLSVFAQQEPYQVFEVDSEAEPRGGMPYLNTFLQVNLRKPLAAESIGLSGRVVISAVIEPDGHVSSVKTINSLRSDCDREAVRAFSLFNAWTPAQKGGKAVRQRVTIPVVFKANQPLAYSNGARISYYDTDQKLLSDSSDKVRYKQVSPVDTNGVPSGDIIVYKAKGSDWKEYYRLPLIRKAIKEVNAAGQQTYQVGYLSKDKVWDGSVFTLTGSGLLVNRSFYKNGQKAGWGLDYHPNGAVAQKTEEFENGSSNTSWYANGQIRQLSTTMKQKALAPAIPASVAAYWDSLGHQLVNNGNGRAICIEQVQSKADTARYTIFTEEGSYQDGLKQGIWTGRYADGSYFYEEDYDKGICQHGKALTAGSDTLHYTEVEKQAEFIGGMPALGQFLGQNLRYPPDAQRARVQGKIFISFTVCTDGTLCDYEVVNSVHPDLDREAVRVVQKMSGKWKPGARRGQNVQVKYNLPINFALL